MSTSTEPLNPDLQKRELIRKASSSVFNYWFGYVANLTLVVWLISRAFTGSVPTPSVFTWLALGFGGLLFWTLCEFLLHKFLYHDIPSPIKMGHDIHHDEPKSLLGVPWYLTSIILVGIFYLASTYFNPANTGIFMAFTWLGYIGYCFVHHAVHHFNWKNRWFLDARKRHLIHHVKNNYNWGITVDIWDRLFRTKA